MGGKPSKGTKKDMRLARNKPKAATSAKPKATTPAKPGKMGMGY